MVLVLAILTSLVDGRFSEQSLELLRSEQSHRQLVESVPVILWRASLASGAFTFIDREAQDVLGCPPSAWTTTPTFWLDHVHPEDRELPESCYRAVVENQGPNRFEHRMIAVGGTVVWFRTLIRLTPVKNQLRKSLERWPTSPRASMPMRALRVLKCFQKPTGEDVLRRRRIRSLATRQTLRLLQRPTFAWRLNQTWTEAGQVPDKNRTLTGQNVHLFAPKT
jgi:PAS domain-containing protein